ncbi:Minichromosome loss protein 1 [Termitomyces sp. J132]|nr:Minichromosome loss protein 1 [Termitomyces sp. J132]
MANLVTNQAHESGTTCMTFSRDGTHAYTGGQDCIVRIWKMSEGVEQEPMTASEADQSITAVAASVDSWLSGSEDSAVRQYFKHKSELTGHVWDANGVAIRSLAVDSEGKRVGIASENFDVRVVYLEDIKIVKQLKGHIGSVRKVTWHPNTPLLTTSGADGKIIVWNLSNEEPQIETTIDGLIPAIADPMSPDYAHDCSAVWHISGQHFYAASRTHEIVTVSRSDWFRSTSFSDKDLSGPITALAVSVNGEYLACASRSKVHVWSIQSRRLIASQPATPGATITHLAFSPKDNLLAWTDTEGGFSRWHKPISETYPDPVRRSIATTAAATVTARPKSNLFDDIAETASSSTRLQGDDGADPEPGYGDVDDDWIIDDLGGGLQDNPESIRKTDGLVKEMVSITKAQPPFQPGSTPLENRKRYLAYNMLGVIEVTDQDTHQIINVEFFDRSARKSYHFNDNFKYDLGYLGERGAAFACPPENEHPAQLLYKPYGTWTNQGEWTYVLKRPGTSVLGIAAGGTRPSGSLRHSDDLDLQGWGNVVVATSEGDLTFLTGTGRERRILGLGGDFVSMVAGPEWVFVVHRTGATTIDGSQNLSYSIINFEDFSVKQRDALPLPKGHTLKWIGLTDQGAPAMYDSAGYIHILTKFRIPHHASWARVMDTNLLERRQGKDESYWPVGITESNFMCLILKGRQEHPGFPRPLIQELPLRMPFRLNEPKEELVERESLLVQIALDSLDEELTTDDILKREHAMDREFIILIQAACKADNVPRAIELTKLLHNISSFDSAMKISDFYHLVGLREKIAILKADREENEDRLVAARDKRRRWLKPDPPLRELLPTNDSGTNSRTNLLGDVRPPPTIERPRLTRVTTPVVETTRYSSVAPLLVPSIDGSSFTDDVDIPVSVCSSADGKRKRTEVEDSEYSFPTPPSKQKVNPFARKPGQEMRNPFARKADVNGKTIQKSESFFDKVGAGEPEAGPFAKVSTKDKSLVRQTTLFGMGPSIQKEKKPKPKKGVAVAPVNETQSLQIADRDVMMTYPIQKTQDLTLVETQPAEESLGSETQLLDE